RVDRPLNQRLSELFGRYPDQADRARDEAWNAELGEVDHQHLYTRIAHAIGKADRWVLIGGPPCQAYSLVGRSRNKGNASYRSECVVRQFLYVEYLRVLADHQPAVCVMENVKGLLSAKVQRRRIFDRIVDDLSAPREAIEREGRKTPSR